MKAARKIRQGQRPRSLLEHVRQFLTPQVCKQARHAVPRRRAHPRWDLQPLLVIAPATTWVSGDSQAEKFQTARGFSVASHGVAVASPQVPSKGGRIRYGIRYNGRLERKH